MAAVDTDGTGIWVRLTMTSGVEVVGRAVGADSPNDFWTLFKTHMVRLEPASSRMPGGEQREYGVLHVNRETIELAETIPAPGGVPG